MRYASSLVVGACLLTGCHGISPNPLPAQPTPTDQTPAVIHLNSIPPALPQGGGTATIKIEVIAANGTGAPNVTVALTTERGDLTTARVVTDSTGHAQTAWTGTATSVVRGTAADLSGETTVSVFVPPPPPPNIPPVIQPPPPPPTPIPQPPPSLAATLTVSPSQVPEGGVVSFTVALDNLRAGEMAVAYQWDYDGNGTTDDTTITATRTHAYPSAGLVTARVLVETSLGRQAGASTRVVVYRP